MDRFKYPRTRHLPWSPGATSDDKFITSLDDLETSRIVITLKADGENTTLYSDGYYHARSIDSARHESRSHLATIAAGLAMELPATWRVCGENLYARHSIAYDDLESYFYAFSIWDGRTCLDWDTTRTSCEMLGLSIVPVIYDGPWIGEPEMMERFAPYRDRHEGFVVRTADAFDVDEFGSHVAKWVRPGHVQTSEHWMHQSVTKNMLASQG